MMTKKIFRKGNRSLQLGQQRCAGHAKRLFGIGFQNSRERKRTMRRPRAVKVEELSFWSMAVFPLACVGAVVVLGIGIADIDAELWHVEERKRMLHAPGWEPGGHVFWIGMFLVLYAAVLHGSRCATVAYYYMAEVLWGCNASLVLGGIGMCTKRPLLVGTATLVVGIDQLAWYIDCVSWIFTGKFPVGVASYLPRKTTSRTHFWTSFHHLFFLPLCFFTLRGIGMPALSYWMSVLLTSLLVIAARVGTPFSIDEKTQIKVFNINMSYGFWEDIDLPYVHAMDFKHPVLYLPYLIIVCNFFLNTWPVLGLYAVVNELR